MQLVEQLVSKCCRELRVARFCRAQSASKCDSAEEPRLRPRRSSRAFRVSAQSRWPAPRSTRPAWQRFHRSTATKARHLNRKPGQKTRELLVQTRFARAGPDSRAPGASGLLIAGRLGSQAAAHRRVLHSSYFDSFIIGSRR